MVRVAPPGEYSAESSGRTEGLARWKWEGWREIGLGQLFLRLNCSTGHREEWPTGMEGS